jgi:XTP/dITP diphosphohydrolase
MSALLTATRNAHKAREIQQILGGDFQYLTLCDFPGAPAVVEDAATFAGNAAKKAGGLADWLALNFSAVRAAVARPEGTLYILADDSGLEVDVLNGAPGVHSARFAGLDFGGAANSSDADNNAKLLRLLRDVPMERRTGRFRCVLAWRELVMSSNGLVEFGNEAKFFDGACDGRISFSEAGAGGFGYDPLFVPNGHSQSFAELGDAVKNGMSHRARALQKLKEYLGNR